MKVISVDPGYDRLGVAIMELENGSEKLIHSECIETDKKLSLTERLKTIGDRFEALLLAHSPTALGIETLFFNKNQKTAMGVAQARGILIYLAQTHNCTVYEFSPQEIKVATTGYGKSDKAAVIDMVRRLITDAPVSALDDEYDAIAVGITCLAHHGRTK
ncbi:MAG: crossover junction endodeoxyribonuclease RuvC [Candidatus Kaiserbacteria bacterium]|nr:crossover junction endodeoxyribonuclease RuvC [Candidatus Kaiserbacteria bacterium]MCB9816493.1 crossover junction endodeoxyribonuclease RuvC [Candidatus Nomurabacteria bacterium]